jgi:hypothetical protein
MLKFSTIEIINKIIGFVVTALLARILTNDFGTYLYYQTIFGYLYAFALFSSDYNFLVNYKIDKQFIGSKAYYQTIFIKLVLVVLILIISIFYLIPNFKSFAFWPYLISIASSLFVYDFILYIENDKKNLILYRFLSQLATIGCVLLFYFQLLDSYYITIIQAVQTVLMTFGTYLAANKYMQKKAEGNSFLNAVQEISIKHIGSIASYFLLRNFIVFFTTIELVFLSYKHMLSERDVFAEGLRLSGILMPFALFYINFNINKIKRGYYTAIIALAVVLLLISPVYVLAFMGETFIDKTYFYNFFIWVFVFNAFLEKDYVELLTQDQHKKTGLINYNIVYFTLSSFLFYVLIQTPLPTLTIISFFAMKLLIYYILLTRKFSLKLRYTELISSFLIIILLNIALYYFGYYNLMLQYLVQLKNVLV